MTEFTPRAFAAFLRTAAVAVEATGHLVLDRAAAQIERTAKAKFGHYQPGAESYPAWAPLKEATKEDRARQGYPADEPLLRSGDLRDSTSRAVARDTAVIGSTSEIAVYHELGDAKLPPRPVFGPSAVENAKAIEASFGVGLVAAMASGKLLRRF